MITRIAIFDFDGTLFRSPNPPKWWDKGHWWRQPESLLPPCVPERPSATWWNKSLVSLAKKRIDDKSTHCLLLTGRWAQVFAPRVRELARQQGLHFDEVLLPDSPGSLPFKRSVLVGMLDAFPDTKVVEVYDDHPGHARSFKAMLAKRGVQVRINDVKVKPHEVACPETAFPKQLAAGTTVGMSVKAEMDELLEGGYGTRVSKRDLIAAIQALPGDSFYVNGQGSSSDVDITFVVSDGLFKAGAMKAFAKTTGIPEKEVLLRDRTRK